MRRYLDTYYKSRYLVSEIAIASGLRDVTEEHWRFCAKKLVERNERYRSVALNVVWILTPTKVTAHRDLLRDYLGSGKFSSWASLLLKALEAQPDYPSIYFNPASISGLEDFFLFDSHWTWDAARKYVEPVLAALGVAQGDLQLIFDNVAHQGNCNNGPLDAFSKERANYYDSKQYHEIFKSQTKSVPDFSIHHGKNPDGKLGRGLIIHSSSYAYARGSFRSAFSSITEVFSPYVPESVIRKGSFDHVIIFFAERNAAVVYDGGPFGERIKQSLNIPYIREIAQELLDLACEDGYEIEDINFMHALGKAWLGEPHES